MAADLLALEQALTQLEKLDARCGQVLHLTYFGGLDREEVAAILNISVPTVARDLRFSRAWVDKAMAGEA
jgi:RNA polymerase sigma factor (sigma-70 family)